MGFTMIRCAPWVCMGAVLCCVTTAEGGPVVDRLLSDYGKIQTVTCHIRRVKRGAAGTIKFLSRVYWTNQDCIHAEGITPIKRRTIADGERLYQYVEGAPKGFSRAIDKLSEQMKISLRLVPGTAMEHLLRLKGRKETPLPPDHKGCACVGIQGGANYVVLAVDDADRLVRLTFFKSDKREQTVAEYQYSDFAEVLPGVWVPLTHHATITGGESEFDERVKVDRFVVNQPIARSLFMASEFFDKGVDFVDDFEKIFANGSGT